MQPICNKIAPESKLSCGSAGFALTLSDTVVPSDAACWKEFLSRKLLERIFPTFPRKYGRSMQPICNKIAPENKLSCRSAGFALTLSDTVVPSDAACWKEFLSRKLLERIFPTFPRKYGRSMQPICNKIAPVSKLSCDFIANVHFLLYLCTPIINWGILVIANLKLDVKPPKAIRS